MSSSKYSDLQRWRWGVRAPTLNECPPNFNLRYRNIQFYVLSQASWQQHAILSSCSLLVMPPTVLSASFATEGGDPYLGHGPKCDPSTGKAVPKYDPNRTQVRKKTYPNTGKNVPRYGKNRIRIATKLQAPYQNRTKTVTKP